MVCAVDKRVSHAGESRLSCHSTRTKPVGVFFGVSKVNDHKFEGSNPQYKHLSEQERWIEYGRRKAAWVSRNGYSDPAAYDAMIKRLCDELGG